MDSARKSDIRGFLENSFIDWNNINIAVSSATIESTDNPEQAETYTVVFVHRGPLAGKKHTDSYVKTKYDNIEIQYYEYWRELEEIYILERIYMNLSYSLGANRFAMLAIHVDPLKRGRYSVYEAMPHYHFYLAPRPISKMHIPLDPITGVSSIEEYSSLKKLFMASIKAMSKELETRHRLTDTKIEKFLRAWSISED